MMTLTGTVKSAGVYDVNGKNGKTQMISMNVADEIGTIYSCQMWSDDQQFAHLAGVINGNNLRFQPVQLVVQSYTVRMRKMKDNTEKPQANFLMTNVAFPNLNASTAA